MPQRYIMTTQIGSFVVETVSGSKVEITLSTTEPCDGRLLTAASVQVQGKLVKEWLDGVHDIPPRSDMPLYAKLRALGATHYAQVGGGALALDAIAAETIRRQMADASAHARQIREAEDAARCAEIRAAQDVRRVLRHSPAWPDQYGLPSGDLGRCDQPRLANVREVDDRPTTSGLRGRDERAVQLAVRTRRTGKCPKRNLDRVDRTARQRCPCRWPVEPPARGRKRHARPCFGCVGEDGRHHLARPFGREYRRCGQQRIGSRWTQDDIREAGSAEIAEQGVLDAAPVALQAFDTVAWRHGAGNRVIAPAGALESAPRNRRRGARREAHQVGSRRRRAGVLVRAGARVYRHAAIATAQQRSDELRVMPDTRRVSLAPRVAVRPLKGCQGV